MPALQVRDLPQDIYDRLVLSAERDHRSLAQQTTYILEQHLRHVDDLEEVPTISEASHGVADMGYAARARTPQSSTSAIERKQRKLQLFARGRALLESSQRNELTPAEDLLAALRAKRDERLEVTLGIGSQGGEPL